MAENSKQENRILIARKPLVLLSPISFTELQSETSRNDGNKSNKVCVQRCFLCKDERLDPDTSFHRFPHDEKLREQWKKVCNVDKSEDVNKLMICSKHFESSDLVTTEMFTRKFKVAVPNAVPSILVPNPPDDKWKILKHDPSSRLVNEGNEKSSQLLGESASNAELEGNMVEMKEKNEPATVLQHVPTEESTTQRLESLDTTGQVVSTNVTNGTPDKKNDTSFWRTCFLCGYKSPGSPSIAFHKFPNDPIVRNKWKKACNLTDRDEVSTLKICGKHFHPEDYNTTAKTKGVIHRIKPGVVPSIGVPNPLFEHNGNQLSQVKRSRTVLDCDKKNIFRCSSGKLLLFSPRTKRLSPIVRTQSAFKDGEPRVVLRRLNPSDLHKYTKKKELKSQSTYDSVIREEPVNVESDAEENQNTSQFYCCLCKQTASETVTLHKFPSLPSVCREWKRICGFSFEQKVCHLRICSEHFLPEDFNKSNYKYGLVQYLLPKAVPSVKVMSRKEKHSDSMIDIQFKDVTSVKNTSEPVNASSFLKVIFEEPSQPLNSGAVDQIENIEDEGGNQKSKRSCFLCNCEREDEYLHKFPIDANVNMMWRKVCNLHDHDYINISTMSICSDHFKDDDFIFERRLNSEIAILKPGAIPTVHVHKHQRASLLHSSTLENEPPTRSSSTDTAGSSSTETMINRGVIIKEELLCMDNENESTDADDGNIDSSIKNIPDTSSENIIDKKRTIKVEPVSINNEDINSIAVDENIKSSNDIPASRPRYSLSVRNVSELLAKPKEVVEEPKETNESSICNLERSEKNSCTFGHNYRSTYNSVPPNISSLDAQHVSQSVFEPEDQPVPQPVGRHVPNPSAQCVFQPIFRCIIPPVSQPIMQPITHFVSHSASHPMNQPFVRAIAPSDSQPVAQRITQPFLAPVAQRIDPYISQPISQSVAQPISNSVAFLVPPASQVSQPICQPFAQTTAPPNSPNVSQAKPHPVACPVVSHSTAQQVSQPVTQPVTRTVTQPVPQPVVEHVTCPKIKFVYANKRKLIPEKINPSPVEKPVVDAPSSSVPSKVIPNIESIVNKTNFPENISQTHEMYQCIKAHPKFTTKPMLQKINSRRLRVITTAMMPQTEQNDVGHNSSYPVVNSSFTNTQETELIVISEKDSSEPPPAKKNCLSVPERSAEKEAIKKQIHCLQDVLSHLQKKDMLSKDLADNLMNMVSDKCKESISKKLRRELLGYWSMDLKSFALTLHLLAGDAYNYLHYMWPNILVPKSIVMKNWSTVKYGKPGFSSEILEVISLHCHRKTHKEINSYHQHKDFLCNVSICEIPLRQELFFENNRFYGGVNFGSEENPQSDNIVEAQNVLVFFVNSLVSSWRVPVGYFLIRSLNAKERANLLAKCLDLLHQINMIVLSITIDGSLVNTSMCCHLGANFTYGKDFKPWIVHPATREKIFVLWDPCRMMKLVRDTLGDKGVLLNSENKLIKWSHIKELFQLQTENHSYHTKLTETHINYQKKRTDLKICFQTLSQSVHKEIMSLMMLHEPLREADNTARFCLIFNNIFDMLNSRNKFTRKSFGAPISDISISKLRKYALMSINYIISLKYTCDTKFSPLLNTCRKTGFLGLIVCLTNIFMIYEKGKEFGLTYLFTHRLSLDYARTFFSVIQKKEKNNLFSAKEFEEYFRKLSLRYENNSERYNCLVDGTDILKMLSQKEHYLYPICYYKNEVHNGLKICDHWKTVPLSYLSGFVVGNILKMTICTICASHLTDVKENLKGGSFDRHKEYYIPSKSVLQICKTARRILHENGNYKLQHSNINFFVNKAFSCVCQTVFNTEEMLIHIMDQDYLDNHKSQLCKLVLEMFFNMSII